VRARNLPVSLANTFSICSVGRRVLASLLMKLPKKQSLVAQTYTILKEEIHAGAWPRGLPTERELCIRLAVSRPTVRSGLAQLVREGFVLRRGRRLLVTKKKYSRAPRTTPNIVLITPQPLYTLLPLQLFCLDSLREHLEAAGWHLDVQYRPACHTPRPDFALEEMAERIRPGGWVLLSCGAPVQRWFSKRALPCVITGSRHEGVALPSVDIDYQALCRHAAGLLLAKGHKRLAFLNPRSGLAGDLESEVGFKEAGARGKYSNRELIIGHHDGTRDGLCNRLAAMLEFERRPTGFLVSGPYHALTTHGFLINQGLRLPRDAALISRDGDLFFAHTVPTLAQYAINPALLARKITRLVLQLVQSGTGSVRDYRIMPTFVPGETFE
jgi:DNA-binding LacI/PurR family transcriptional regulator